MSDEAKILIVGAYMWGSHYAAGVFIAALAWHVEWAAVAIILSAGLAYLCQVLSVQAQLSANAGLAKVSVVFMIGSVAAGVVAGLLLLARI